jgi:sigma-54 dependent transcriptional regulator, acetoin dehydrogenase operon transcriptional activator AcoR
MSQDGEHTETAAQGRGRAAPVALPHLVVVFDGGAPLAAPVRWPLAGIKGAVLGRGVQRNAQRKLVDAEWRLEVTLPDSQVSREHLRLERVGQAWRATDLGSRNGSWVDGERLVPQAPRELAAGSLLQLGRTLVLLQDVAGAGDVETLGHGLATLVPELGARFADLVAVVVEARANVLLAGPSGSGKELVARAIHRILADNGRRGELVAVNCSALPATLVEAELFGALRGAFSGATEDRLGLVRAAHRGTLLLDEIGDLTPASQGALLRVLQEREVLPVGATRPVPVDLVVVSATHRDLPAMRARGDFREDLFARLAGFELALPPLAGRLVDLGLIIAALLERRGARPTFSADAVLALSTYPWPRNARELEAALAQALALAGEAPIAREHLPPTVRLGRHAPPSTAPSDERHEPLGERDARIKQRLVALLGEHRGNVAAVARVMGKHRRQIHRWMERFGVDGDRFRPE